MTMQEMFNKYSKEYEKVKAEIKTLREQERIAMYDEDTEAMLETQLDIYFTEGQYDIIKGIMDDIANSI